MCYRINPEFVLANYFQYASKPLTFGKLRQIRNAIQSEIDDCVYVDVSTPSVSAMVELYPKMFKWIGDCIGRVEDTAALFNEEIEYFNEEVNESIRSKALHAIEESVKAA